jgi:hypothetical protein
MHGFYDQTFRARGGELTPPLRDFSPSTVAFQAHGAKRSAEEKAIASPAQPRENFHVPVMASLEVGPALSGDQVKWRKLEAVNIMGLLSQPRVMCPIK